MLDSPYIGEIRIFAGNFAPLNWKVCDGSLQPISQYETLFALIGTTYGGDGQSTFALPDLRGRVPVHVGTGGGLSPVVLGQKAGVESVTMTTNQMPSHTHPLMAQSAEANANLPATNAFANTGSGDLDYALGTVAPDAQLGNQSISVAGGSAPFDIVQPSLVVNYIISMAGVWPSQN
ncbi:phage tail protein [Pedobacter sp. GSP4]|uniref:phage tail protein n=1 Tax=Pedobacter sp. GSP4 TaxID=3453716 RepID=UPI003EE94D5A